MARKNKRRPHGSRAKRWKAIASQLASKLNGQEVVRPEPLIRVEFTDADIERIRLKATSEPPVVTHTPGPLELEIGRRMDEGVETMYTDAIDKLVDLPDVLRRK